MDDDRDRKLGVPSRLRALWRGEVPLREAFWWHAMAVGTLVNLLATLLFVALNALGTPNGIAVVAFLLPVPYNFFVVVAVWHSADHYTGPPIRAHMARLAVSLWAIAATLT